MAVGRSFYISGAHSGSNPSPGLGTALSLRAAFPEARLVGVDYSTASTGLHHPVFDDVVVVASWDHIDMDVHREFIATSTSDPDAWWFSGLDLEAAWLARAGFDGQVLVSPSATFEAIAKPAARVASAMSLHLPASTSTNDADGLNLSFVDEYGWPVWVKGRQYEAFAAASWLELDAGIASLERSWGPGVVVQQHVDGAEESIAFGARRGRLVGAVAMRKLATTAEGKTWAGEIRALSEEEQLRLAAFTAEMAWNGGGEIEMVRRSSDSARFLIDVNPRFPAWIHGSTRRGGVNLPAALIDPTASGTTPPVRFTRVVIEIALRDALPVQIPTVGVGGQPGAMGKHPSGMPVLSRRLGTPIRDARQLPVDDALQAVLDAVASRVEDTPCAVFDFDGLAADLQDVADRSHAIGLWPALSIKTNPDPRILTAARRAGWMAEAITGLEIDGASHAGWPASEVVLNGPAKSWPRTDASLPYRAVFYDSVAELDASREGYSGAQHLGFRLRPLRALSRFGVDCSSPSDLREVAARLRELTRDARAASHIHVASSTIGIRAWNSEIEATLALAVALQHLSERTMSLIDLGGGFTPVGLQQLLTTSGSRLVTLIGERLPGIEQIVFEPGKAIMAPHGYVVTRVLYRSGEDLFVDGSIAELCDTVSLRRLLYARRRDSWCRVAPGSGRIFGRSCIEEDVVARGVNLGELQTDDLLVFANTGAYDASMRYSFASAGAAMATA